MLTIEDNFVTINGIKTCINLMEVLKEKGLLHDQKIANRIRNTDIEALIDNLTIIIFAGSMIVATMVFIALLIYGR